MNSVFYHWKLINIKVPEYIWFVIKRVLINIFSDKAEWHRPSAYYPISVVFSRWEWLAPPQLWLDGTLVYCWLTVSISQYPMQLDDLRQCRWSVSSKNTSTSNYSRGSNQQPFGYWSNAYDHWAMCSTFL